MPYSLGPAQKEPQQRHRDAVYSRGFKLAVAAWNMKQLQNSAFIDSIRLRILLTESYDIWSGIALAPFGKAV